MQRGTSSPLFSNTHPQIYIWFLVSAYSEYNQVANGHLYVRRNRAMTCKKFIPIFFQQHPYYFWSRNSAPLFPYSEMSFFFWFSSFLQLHSWQFPKSQISFWIPVLIIISSIHLIQFHLPKVCVPLLLISTHIFISCWGSSQLIIHFPKQKFFSNCQISSTYEEIPTN